MRNIFCYGNEYFKGDEVAKELAIKHLTPNKNFKFIPSDSPNDILNQKGEIIIMDVINDIQLLSTITCHDIDLGFYLKLMKETQQINKIKIIGLPFENTNYKYLKKEVEKIIKKI